MLAMVAKQRFQSVAMSLRDGVVCASNQGMVTFCNPAAETIFGLSAAETIGRPLEDLLKVRASIETVNLAKPVKLIKLLSDAAAPLECIGVRKSGEIFPLEVSLSTWPDNDGFQYGAVLRDITERKREEDRIRHLALHDSLTGALNRAGLRSAITAALAASSPHARVALILLDLDDFKEVNDTLGHQAGDQCLRHVAACLGEIASPNEAVGRLGGDEFALVMQGEGAEDRAHAAAQAIIAKLQTSPHTIENRSICLKAAVGVAVSDSDSQTVDELLANADLALYRAKSNGRAPCVVYTPALRHVLEQRRVLEQELADAFARNEFELFYQPQVRLDNKTIVGVEALLRWQHPTRGTQGPAQFLDVLNGSSLSSEVGNWVVRTACTQGQKWNLMGRPTRVGVNLASSQFRGDLVPFVASALQESGLPPDLLELEVTENIVLEQGGTQARAMLECIRAMGVGVAFDDFGTGYASLTHLRQFPLSRLKIDRSFVRDLQSDQANAAIVSAVAQLGKRLGISVTVEGVEDAQLLTLLEVAGCDEGQGYLFGKPMPALMMERLLEIRKQSFSVAVPTAA
jgi:diguanylate cyclase (GGDEF)-like protein/PAS domain S-box-containing protein